MEAFIQWHALQISYQIWKIVFPSEPTPLNFSTMFCQPWNVSAFSRKELARMQGLVPSISLFSWLAFCRYNNSNNKKPQKNPLQNVAIAADILMILAVKLFVFRRVFYCFFFFFNLELLILIWSIWRFTYDSTTVELNIWSAAWIWANKSGDVFLSHSLEELGCKGLTESWKYWGKSSFSEIWYARLP